MKKAESDGFTRGGIQLTVGPSAPKLRAHRYAPTRLNLQLTSAGLLWREAGYPEAGRDVKL